MITIMEMSTHASVRVRRVRREDGGGAAIADATGNPHARRTRGVSKGKGSVNLTV